ncbi:hypothetical protein OG585_37775 [Streptomyces sp. NBC_01340]|uniref:hypothetical protein n=1 Tax=unclassified Streptomyces TaxID=2593676 RepID=UPI002253608C|nr:MULTISPECIES: hypothetical protein [unclassified Streptomyces]MCX4458274.1 hypothetical protein [Streptomyces sp. NBC_01719]MCX4497631.1 hypothetical protein [Streptomyces sp. NBC_01728]WSI42457.1 hypothetical protein OG585_37775 [Streptomyces sp. NBC_01340]
MSEYQYYEFLAVDRALSEDELAQVRALSTRAHITATSFSNEYHWGDFRGDTTKMVEQLYDAHLYYANWGSRRLVLRLPAALLPAKAATPYALEESLSVWTSSGHTLLDFQLPSEDGGEWDFESSFSLSAFIGLRAELAAGDLRGLYLAWLAALSVWELAEDDEEEYAREVEPPVPAGLAELTGPQRALADFLRVDPDLLAVAAQAAAPAPQTAVDRKALAAYIATLPAKEKDTLLLEAALGTAPQPGPQLLAHYRAACLPGPRTTTERRTAAQLLDAAHLHRIERARRETEEKAAAARARALGISRARDARLDRLGQDTEQAWQDIDKLIAEKKPGPYDTAVTLLTDLREIHARGGTSAAFEQRAGALREIHRGKPSLMRRFDAAGLPNS